MGRQVANAHTIFNIVITLVVLPISGYFVKFVNKVLPDDEEKKVCGAIYLDKNLLETPVVASTQVIKETMRMAKIARANFQLSMKAFFCGNDDIERVGDHVENIVELAINKFTNKVEMSKEALKEIEEIFEATLDSLDIAIRCFAHYDRNNDKIVNEVEERIDMLEKRFRNNNITRLNSKQCYANAGVIFFDLLSNLERMGDHVNNIATVKENHIYRIHA